MPPITRSGQQPQRRKAKERPARPPPADRFKSSCTRKYWKDRIHAFSTDPLYHLGIHFARSVHPFIEPKRLISVETLATHRLKKLSLVWRNMPSKERRDHRYFLTLERLLLLHGEDLTKLTGAARSHVEDLVRKGQSAAWSTDLASARTLISCRLGIACCGQGFDNDAIGRLLCPIGSDWNSGEVKNALRSTPQSSGVGAWPAVFYQNLGFDPQKPWEGFLRNRLLVVTYRRIFGVRARCASALSAHLTLNSIVYVATLVISALSGPNTYLCGRNRLPHKRLFDTLFNHVDEHRDAMEVKELILWWDRQIRGREANASPGWSENRPSILAKFSAARLSLNIPVASTYRDQGAGLVVRRPEAPETGCAGGRE